MLWTHEEVVWQPRDAKMFPVSNGSDVTMQGLSTQLCVWLQSPAPTGSGWELTSVLVSWQLSLGALHKEVGSLLP